MYTEFNMSFYCKTIGGVEARGGYMQRKVPSHFHEYSSLVSRTRSTGTGFNYFEFISSMLGWYH